MQNQQLTRALLEHFDAHQRDLPWRATDDPYAVWVSEVMLQQTRVETVVPYYERWLDRFPTVEALADADLDDVLREWQGLGYYSRARNLHKAAAMVREQAGAFPTDYTSLRTLPGIGEYTAGAVASIAFGERVPAVDGNVRRVVARLYDLPDPTTRDIRERVEPLIPDERPGDFNQALMELGATVCSPRSPDCHRCPVRRWCEAQARGVQEERPRPRRRTPIPEETEETAVLVRPDGRALLVRRPEDGLLGGMWEFPGDNRPAAISAAIDRADPVQSLDPVPHVFTHKKVTYLPTLFASAGGVGAEPVEEDAGAAVPGPGIAPRITWRAFDDMDAFALPVAQQKIAKRAAAAWAGRRRQTP